MKLLKIIQTVSPDKARIIDQITDFHPGQGVKLDWAWYVGGMKDTGDWYIDKLIEVPQEVLEEKLNQWKIEKEEADRKQKEFNDWFKCATPEEITLYQEKMWQKEQDCLKKMREDKENSLIWRTKTRD